MVAVGFCPAPVEPVIAVTLASLVLPIIGSNANHWQQCQLNGRSKAARVGELGASTDLVALKLGQTIYIAIVLVAIVLGKVDDLQGVRTLVLSPESSTLAVTRAKEKHVDGVEVVCVGEALLGIAYQTSMYGVERLTGIASGVRKGDLHLWVIDQEADEFACGIARCANYAYFDHNVSSSWLA